MASRHWRRQGAIKPTGTWSLGTRAGDFVYIAGSGIDPKTNSLVEGDKARVRQAFMNMKLIAESEGATLCDAVRLVVYVTDMFRFRPLVNKIQAELWGQGPYPPRTIVEVHRLNQDDIVEKGHSTPPRLSLSQLRPVCSSRNLPAFRLIQIDLRGGDPTRRKQNHTLSARC
jgi:enamine deaminase RidA (YjgF/YER057c/UK114 family)